MKTGAGIEIEVPDGVGIYSALPVGTGSTVGLVPSP
jgi:hypothetical protein